MRTFKEFLKEDTTLNWFLTDRKEIEKLLNLKIPRNPFSGRNEGYVNDKLEFISSDVARIVLTDKQMLKIGGKLYLPCQFATIVRKGGWGLEFRVQGDIGSLKGLPETMGSPLDINANSVVFDYFPRIIHDQIYFGDDTTGLSTLTGIGKVAGTVDSIFLNKSIKSNVLGLLKFKFAENIVDCICCSGSMTITPLSTTCEIMSRHAHGDADLLDCQEELIKAGLKEFAKL